MLPRRHLIRGRHTNAVNLMPRFVGSRRFMAFIPISGRGVMPGKAGRFSLTGPPSALCVIARHAHHLWWMCLAQTRTRSHLRAESLQTQLLLAYPKR
jgi:hypothetical protein